MSTGLHRLGRDEAMFWKKKLGIWKSSHCFTGSHYGLASTWINKIWCILQQHWHQCWQWLLVFGGHCEAAHLRLFLNVYEQLIWMWINCKPNWLSTATPSLWFDVTVLLPITQICGRVSGSDCFHYIVWRRGRNKLALPHPPSIKLFTGQSQQHWGW